MIDMVKAWECGYPYCVIPVSVYHQLLEVTANIKALGIFISLQQYVWQGAIQLEVTAPLQDSASATKAGQATCVVSAFLHPAAIQLEATAPLQDSAYATKAGQATCVVIALLHPAAIQLEVTALLQDGVNATKAGEETCVISALLHLAAVSWNIYIMFRGVSLQAVAS